MSKKTAIGPGNLNGGSVRNRLRKGVEEKACLLFRESIDQP
jgi:hypothetical protein